MRPGVGQNMSCAVGDFAYRLDQLDLLDLPFCIQGDVVHWLFLATSRWLNWPPRFHLWAPLHSAGELAALEEDEEGEGWGDDAELMIDEGGFVTTMQVLCSQWQYIQLSLHTSAIIWESNELL